MDYRDQPVPAYLREFLNKQVQGQQKAAKAQAEKQEKQKKRQERLASRPPAIIEVLNHRQTTSKHCKYLVRRYVCHTHNTSCHAHNNLLTRA